MAIVKKTFLDLIHLQFSYGGEHQTVKTIGDLNGAHFSETEYLVDSKTGEVLGKTNNPLNGQTRELEIAKVSGVIGDQFPAMALQIGGLQRTLEETVKASNAAIGELDAMILEREAAIVARDERIAEMGAQVEDQLARLAATDVAIKERDSSIKDRERQIYELLTLNEGLLAKVDAKTA